MEPKEIAELVGRAGDLVAEHYVFADVGARVRDVLAAGTYGGEPVELAAAVTRDLQSVNGDLHLRLKYQESEIPTEWDEDAQQAAQAAEAAARMGGVGRVERLDGNVALLELTNLYSIQHVGAAINAAMQLVATADALLLDLRRNGGGDPRTVALVCGHLFAEHSLLVTMHQRDTGEIWQSWSVPWVPGPRFGGTKPVYVLVGPATFSGAEELAYDLQQLRPGSTVVGERTKGGAHPCEGYRLHPHLELTVPIARAISPATNGNWEGTGVTPDIPVPVDEARETAYRLALATLSERSDR